MTRRRVTHGLMAVLVAATAGCAALKEGLSKAVQMDYDQVNNFRTYDFAGNTSVSWGGGAQETGIFGFADQSSPDTWGFWVTYLICNLRNEGSNAEPFDYDPHNFYVDYGGKRHYYKPLDAYTYTSVPNQLPGNPSATSTVNTLFRTETQLGPDADTFQPGYFPTVNYRISIYVTRDASATPLDVAERLPLRYDNYPNVLNPRNQEPVVLDPGRGAELRTTCRPQVQ